MAPKEKHVVCWFIIVGVLARAIRRKHMEGSATLLSWRERFEQNPEMFKGCKHIFLDVGANRGTHVRKLFEAPKYPDAPYLAEFDMAFGDSKERSKPSSETQICAFGFDANPRWAPALEKVEKAYGEMGWRVMFFAPVAVSDGPGQETMYLNDKDGVNSDWGYSKMSFATDIAPKRVVVNKFDFAPFIAEMNKHIVPGGYKLMKMDIEGAEFEVLAELMDQGLLCTDSTDRITIEYHDRFFHEPDELDHIHDVRSRVDDANRCPSVQQQKKNTIVEEIDDESYLNDGMPLPEPVTRASATERNTAVEQPEPQTVPVKSTG
eukprot:TRINITY_DN10054_c0_g1_i4.p1 TRINITY_DN10054_c0_g1~~TRINITY_DN10054_c0_g1_i4.p1  ORF type:complete len:344 (-),score=50.65 TRINITY_DN10054_c0_g1_i4:516-1475(-)